MKRLLSVALVAAVWATTASAGAYHRGTSLQCADCHAMHGQRSHNFVAGAGSIAPGADALMGNSMTNLSPWLTNATQGGNEYLLVAKDTNATCLACHNGIAGIPDVLGANGGIAGTQRPAGRLNEETDGVPAINTGHTLGILLAANPPPGFAPAIGSSQSTAVWSDSAQELEFTCGECHSIHGSPAYRNLGNTRGRTSANLRPNTTSSLVWPNVPTYALGATNPGAGNMLIPARYDEDVVMVNGPKNFNASNAGDNYNSNQIAYTVSNGSSVGQYVASFSAATGATTMYNGTFANTVEGVANPTGKNKMNGFCATCHGNFHGAANTDLTASTGKFKRHPTDTTSSGISGSGTGNGATLINANAAKVPLKLVYNTATNYSPGCLTCHKGHGTTNPFGIVLPADKTQSTGIWGTLDTNLEDGDAGAPSSGAAATGTIRNLCITCHSMGRTGGTDGLPTGG